MSHKPGRCSATAHLPRRARRLARPPLPVPSAPWRWRRGSARAVPFTTTAARRQSSPPVPTTGGSVRSCGARVRAPRENADDGGAPGGREQQERLSRRRRHGTSRRHLCRRRAAAFAPVARVCARHARMRIGKALLGSGSNASAVVAGGQRGKTAVVAATAVGGATLPVVRRVAAVGWRSTADEGWVVDVV